MASLASKLPLAPSLASRFSRRTFLAGAVVGAAAVAACAPAAPPPPTAAPAPAPAPTPTAAPAQQAVPASAGKTQIEFYHPATAKNEIGIINDLVSQYNQKSTKIQTKVTFVPSSNHYAKYVTAIAGGTSPDAIMTYDYGPMVDWASQGFIVPIDDYQKTMGIKQDDYFPVVWPMMFFHGHLWGFMQEFDFRILAWNKTLVQKAGLDPTQAPKTIDDLDKLAAAVTQKDSSGNLKVVGFCPWVQNGGLNVPIWTAARGGRFYDPDNDKWTIVTDPSVATLDWYATYAKLLGGPDKVTAFTKQVTGDQTPFYAEQLATELMGEWEPVSIPDLAPKLQYAVGYPPTAPGVPYGTDLTGGGNVSVLPKGAAHPGEGMDFMVWINGPDPVLKWNVEAYNVPPVKKVAFDDAFISKVSGMKTWIDLLKEDHMVPAITSPIFAFFSDQLNTARDEVTFGKKSSKQALTDLAAKVDDQLKQFKSAHPNW